MAGEGMTEDADLYLLQDPCGAPGRLSPTLIDRGQGRRSAAGVLHAAQGVGTVLTRDPCSAWRAKRPSEDVGAPAIAPPMEGPTARWCGAAGAAGREEIERFTVVVRRRAGGGAALYPFIDERRRRWPCGSGAQHRRARLGEMLLRMERRARALGVERLFVLTTRTPTWFRSEVSGRRRRRTCRARSGRCTM